MLRLLVALPPLVCGLTVLRYGIDVPYWDEWTIATLLRSIDEGRFTPAMLMAQHNEHRMLVSRSIQILAAILWRWDTRVGMWISQAVLVAMLAACAVLWRRRPPAGDMVPALLPLVLLSLILFSPAQYQNLFWGFQFCFFLPAACLLASTLVTSTPTVGTAQALMVAALFSAIATFSILPGLLVWPLAAAGVAMSRGRPRTSTAWAWALWVCSFAASLALYARGYKHPPSPGIWPALRHPLDLLQGVAANLGGVLAVGSRPAATAIVYGIVLGLFWHGLLIALWRRRADRELVSAALPWVIMGTFGVLHAVAVAVGRVGYGVVAVLESRYTSFTCWTLIGVVMVAATLRERVPGTGSIRVWRMAALVALAVMAGGWSSQQTAIRRMYHERLQSLAVYTFAEKAPRSLPLLPEWLDWPSYRSTLLAIEATGWRARRPSQLVWIDAGPSAPCSCGAVEFVEQVDSRSMAGGWAYFPGRDRPADAVIVTQGADRRILVVQPPLIGRGDIGERFGRDDALVSGWTLEFEPASGIEPVEFWALDIQSLRAYPLPRSR